MNSNAKPRLIRIHANDNVAVVVNQGGLAAGREFDDGLVLAETVPEAHKVALTDLAAGDAIVRYGVTIGRANRAGTEHAGEQAAQATWVFGRDHGTGDADGTVGVMAPFVAPNHVACQVLAEIEPPGRRSGAPPTMIPAWPA